MEVQIKQFTWVWNLTGVFSNTTWPVSANVSLRARPTCYAVSRTWRWTIPKIKERQTSDSILRIKRFDPPEKIETRLRQPLKQTSQKQKKKDSSIVSFLLYNYSRVCIMGLVNKLLQYNSTIFRQIYTNIFRSKKLNNPSIIFRFKSS